MTVTMTEFTTVATGAPTTQTRLSQVAVAAAIAMSTLTTMVHLTVATGAPTIRSRSDPARVVVE